MSVIHLERQYAKCINNETYFEGDLADTFEPELIIGKVYKVLHEAVFRWAAERKVVSKAFRKLEFVCTPFVVPFRYRIIVTKRTIRKFLEFTENYSA